MTEFTKTDFSLNANQKAERKLLVTAVNTGTTNEPVWTVIGAGVEDSAIELNPDVETITDILGISETTVNKLEPSQDFEPMTIRGGNPLLFTLNDIIERNALSELTQFEVLIIKAFINEGTEEKPAYRAEKHVGCTITPQSLGGSSYVDMPVNIAYSNDKTLGTVNAYKAKDTIEFTPLTATNTEAGE